jgi:flavin reductase (DIM6/NTAB) family NADH-FMN oxidoreductase RutF
MSEETTAKLLGKVPSGLFIVSAAHNGKRAAYLASFVQQASFKPLIFSVACHPDRYPYQLISSSKRFALNVIPEGDQILLKAFAKGHGPETDPFAAIAHDTLDGLPILKDAIGAATFELISESKPGDHVLLFGQAREGVLFDEGRKPWVHTRKSALNY